MREHLLGYVLGALDEDEHELVESELKRNPTLRAEWRAVQRRLMPLEPARRPYVIPGRLAERACACVEQHRAQPARYSGNVWAEPPASRWKLIDLVAVAGILLAISALFLPALSSSRQSARVLACQQKLQQVSIALADYANQIGNGYYPKVPDSGRLAFAGVYAHTLWEHSLVNDRFVFVCPDSRLADNLEQWSVPNTGEQAGGIYAYNIGNVVSGRHLAPRNRDMSDSPIMSDEPLTVSHNFAAGGHPGGFNLLNGDGSVRFLTPACVDRLSDHPFRNRFGQPDAPGDGRDDVVIAPAPTRLRLIVEQ